MSKSTKLNTPTLPTPSWPMKKTALTGLCLVIAMGLASTSAQAGGRHYQDGSGFILFDIFGQAPSSKYRHPSPKVRGFRSKVGGYSYKFSDTFSSFGTRPTDFSPVFDRGLFSTRLGTDGPYIGD